MTDLRISLFQASAREETPAARLNWLDLAAERAAEEGSKLLICPELYLSGYLAGENLKERAQKIDGDYLDRVGEIAMLHDIAIVYSYPELFQGKLFNAAGFVGSDGRLIAHHRKNHLPSEYENRWFIADQGIAVFDYAGWKMAILICYDIEFPETARQAALAGAELLIVPTALAANWGFVADKLVPTRAFENGVFLAYVNYAGKEKNLAYFGGSRLVGPSGEYLAVATAGDQVLSVDIDKSLIREARRRIPYLENRTKYEL